MNTIANVEFILSQYKNLLADYDKAYTDYLKLQKQKQLHERGKIENDIDVISGMSINSPMLSHIPKSITNKFSSVTENVALNYLQFVLPSKMELAQLQLLIDSKKKILTDSFEQIKLIEQMMGLLNEQEKFIIENIYINGYSLNRTMDMFNKEYPDFYITTYMSMKRKKFHALYKMAKRLNTPI